MSFESKRYRTQKLVVLGDLVGQSEVNAEEWAGQVSREGNSSELE
jgi:hypothetical protein